MISAASPPCLVTSASSFLPVLVQPVRACKIRLHSLNEFILRISSDRDLAPLTASNERPFHPASSKEFALRVPTPSTICKLPQLYPNFKHAALTGPESRSCVLGPLLSTRRGCLCQQILLRMLTPDTRSSPSPWAPRLLPTPVSLACDIAVVQPNEFSWLVRCRLVPTHTRTSEVTQRVLEHATLRSLRFAWIIQYTTQLVE